MEKEQGHTIPSSSCNTATPEPNILKAFQALVGITTPSDLQPEGRSAPNVGLYKEIVNAEKRRRFQYIACASFIDICLLAQIGFAAILTALGASGSPHNVITVFGAINTAIAGTLALMKGRGLPTRLQQDWVGLRKVRDYIEERERDLEQGIQLCDLQTEIKNVIKMYDDVRTTMENNQPDVYVYPGSSMKSTGPSVSHDQEGCEQTQFKA